MLTLVPPARRDAVRAALRSAFGGARVGASSRLGGGVSGAAILRFEVRGRDYVVRLEPDRIGLADRRRHFDCMVAAAQAGVAPPVRHADAAEGVAIMDFVAGRPLSDYPGGLGELARALGALVARLQVAAPFPVLGDYPGMIGALLSRLGASALFPAEALNAHAEGLERIRAALAEAPAAMVPSHNDPNPRNILFDGRRLWWIDWELAAQNDPLVDIAILSTDLAETPALQSILLEAAFGRPPDEFLRARLTLMRLLTRLFYGCIVLANFTRPPPSFADSGGAVLTPAAFRAAVADGRLASGTQEVAYAFGVMSLADFTDGLEAPGFQRALAVLRQS